jgi:hypothetical protein
MNDRRHAEREYVQDVVGTARDPLVRCVARDCENNTNTYKQSDPSLFNERDFSLFLSFSFDYLQPQQPQACNQAHSLSPHLPLQHNSNNMSGRGKGGKVFPTSYASIPVRCSPTPRLY